MFAAPPKASRRSHKLSIQQVIEMRNAYHNDEPIHVIARSFGVFPSTVRYWCSNEPDRLPSPKVSA